MVEEFQCHFESARAVQSKVRVGSRSVSDYSATCSARSFEPTLRGGDFRAEFPVLSFL